MKVRVKPRSLFFNILLGRNSTFSPFPWVLSYSFEILKFVVLFPYRVIIFTFCLFLFSYGLLNKYSSVTAFDISILLRYSQKLSLRELFQCKMTFNLQLSAITQ